MISNGEFVIRNKEQKVRLAFRGHNRLYRVRNLGPGDIKIGEGPKLYLFSGCTMDFFLGSGQMLTLTTEDTAASNEGSNGIETTAGWYEIISIPEETDDMNF